MIRYAANATKNIDADFGNLDILATNSGIGR